MPRVESIPRRYGPEHVDLAVRALAKGDLVVLPTETVYGLAARADDPRIIEKVRAAKGRDANKPFARLAKDLAAIEAEIGPAPRTARTLARAFWPGPLTLVLEPERGGDKIGFRVPGLAYAHEVVAKAGFPILATSANASGGEEPLTAGDAAAALGDRVDLVLDAGPALLGKPSTVVAVPREGAAYQILREGFLSKETLARALSRTILFVCTGNTCRSPMAEGIFRHKLAERLGVPSSDLAKLGWTVRSAGTSAMSGGSAADAAIQVMAERGIDIEEHRSRALTPALVDEAEAIYVMSSSHAHTIEEWFPDAAPKVRLIDPEGVPDPVGQSVGRYRETADHLEARIESALDELLA